jgi:hypothetical protein
LSLGLVPHKTEPDDPNAFVFLLQVTSSAHACSVADAIYLLRLVQSHQCTIPDNENIVCTTGDEQVIIPLNQFKVSLGAYQVQFNCDLGACITDKHNMLGNVTEMYVPFKMFMMPAINDRTRDAFNLCFNGPPPPPVYPWPQQNQPQGNLTRPPPVTVLPQ